MPGNATVAEPGFVFVTPGRGVMRITRSRSATTCRRWGSARLPIVFWYQIQASGLIGSPTVPSRRSDDRSCLSGHSVPHFMNARIAVGAV